MTIGITDGLRSSDNDRTPAKQLGKLFREKRGPRSVPQMITELHKSDLPGRWAVTEANYHHVEFGTIKRPDREILATLIEFFGMTLAEEAAVWRLADRNICHPDHKKSDPTFEDKLISNLLKELFSEVFELSVTEGGKYIVEFVAAPNYLNLTPFEKYEIVTKILSKLVETGKHREKRENSP